MNFTGKSYTSISIATSVAFLIHCIIVLVLYLSDIPNILDRDKTIPIILVSDIHNNASPNRMTQAQNELAANEFLRTLNESNNKIAKANRPSTAPPSPIKPTTSNIPEFELPSASTNTNATKAINDFQNIFNKKGDIEKNTKKQVSTKDSTTLTDYEIKLLNALAKEALYDSFHPIMARKDKLEIDYQITLSLFPNGAIKNAEITKSSNEPEIDKLAIQAAYRASPFPAPPKDDIATRYRYTIPILYKRK